MSLIDDLVERERESAYALGLVVSDEEVQRLRVLLEDPAARDLLELLLELQAADPDRLPRTAP